MKKLRGLVVVGLGLLFQASLADAGGSWIQMATPYPMFILNATMLPDGRILVTNRDRTAAESGTFNETPFRTGVIEPGYFDNPMGQYSYDLCDIRPFHDADVHTVYNLFCSGNTALSDGTIVYAGGHLGNDIGIRYLSVFDPFAPYLGKVGKWSPSPSLMHQGRWYPTLARTPLGYLVIVSGSVNKLNPPTPDNSNRDVEFYLKGTGTARLGDFVSIQPDPTDILNPAKFAAHISEYYYPHMFIDPKDGQLLMMSNGRTVDNDTQTNVPRPYEKLNLATLEWKPYTSIPAPQNVGRSYPASAMVDGIVVRSGGSRQASSAYQSIDNDELDDVDHPLDWATGQTIYCDFNAAAPVWRVAPPMNLGRKDHFLITLPTGQVLAMGGNQFMYRKGGKNREVPEWWDPFNPTQPWQLLDSPDLIDGAANEYGRGYHSVAMLLPDARIFSAGGEFEYNADGPSTDQIMRSRFKRTPRIFSPPYGGRNDWATVRPRITACPSKIRSNDPFTMSFSTFNGKKISAVTLVATAAVTHSTNMNPTSTFVYRAAAGDPGLTAGSYTFTCPGITRVLPGYYMLFVVDNEGRGIPSTAKMIQVVDYDRTYATYVATATTSPGSASELYIPDNVYLGRSLGHPPFSDAIVPVQLVVGTTAPYVNSSTIRLELEGHLANPGNYRSFVNGTVKLEVKNWSTGLFEQISTLQAMSGNDSRYGLNVPAAQVSKYIGVLDRKVELRLTFRSANPFEVWLDEVDFGFKQPLAN